MRTVKECKDILECAMYEVEYEIPHEVLNDTIYYLTEYERLSLKESYELFPEAMGR